MVGLLAATRIYDALIAEYGSTEEHWESGWGLKEGLDNDMTQRCAFAREKTWAFAEFPVIVQIEIQKTSHATQSQIFGSQWNNVGGLYGNIDGFIPWTPRELGRCVWFWHRQPWSRKGNGAELPMAREHSTAWDAQQTFWSVHGTWQSWASLSPRLDLWRDSATCSHSSRAYDWSSWQLPDLPKKIAKFKHCLLLHPQEQPHPTHVHTTLQVH